MSLVTRCPNCQSDFIVSLEQLRVHDGLVRCGHCTNIFDGRAAVESDLPTLTRRAATTEDSHAVSHQGVVLQHSEPSAPSVLRRRTQMGAESEHEAPTTGLTNNWGKLPEAPASSTLTPTGLGGVESVNRPFVASVSEPYYQDPVPRSQPGIRVRGEARLRGEDGVSSGRSVPDFMIDETPLDGLRRALWLILVSAASLLLLVQLSYLYRNELVTRMPALLPLARAACESLKCEVSLVRHLERITIESNALDLAPGGEVDGRSSNLTLKFSLRNRYDRAQPWPAVSVEFKDASGTVVIRKILRPDDYLPEHLAKRPLGAGQEVQLSLPIAVNGAQINSVQLDRFFP